MKCSICGLGPVGQPQHIFMMVALVPWLDQIRRGEEDAPEPDKTEYMRYGYRCANGHAWKSTVLR